MRAILVQGGGREARLAPGEAPRPVPGAGEVLVAVHATSVNRADLLQRRGLYPPPPGASPILGLECAGRVEAVGPAVTRLSPGDRVMALLPGGGYAEWAVAHEGSALPIPDDMSWDEAGAFPEVFLTAFLTLFDLGRVPEHGMALVHGGGSGVGTAAIRLLKLAGAEVIVTCGSDWKGARCRELGADLALNYRQGPFLPRVLAASGGEGVDVVLDMVGAPYLDANLRCLRIGGRLVIIALMGGSGGEIPLGVLLTRRLSVIGSTLRSRSAEEKASLVGRFLDRFGSDLRAGRLRAVIDRVLPLERAQEGHELLERGEVFGKVVLRVRD